MSYLPRLALNCNPPDTCLLHNRSAGISHQWPALSIYSFGPQEMKFECYLGEDLPSFWVLVALLPSFLWLYHHLILINSEMRKKKLDKWGREQYFFITKFYISDLIWFSPQQPMEDITVFHLQLRKSRLAFRDLFKLTASSLIGMELRFKIDPSLL
jgi:hypothetical protein